MSLKKSKLGTILNYEQPTDYIVSDENYDNSFAIPVLTAGKSFLLGYTDEINGIYSNLPAIIFDDFTTASKFVDFPFKVKSSAIKILTTDDKVANLRFMYYLLQTLNVSSSQHKRYWISKFAQIEVCLPSLYLQNRITEILDDVDTLLKKNNLLLQYYENLAQSLFIETFGDCRKNEMKWKVSRLGSLCEKITDGKHGDCYDQDNSGYYFISAKDIYEGKIHYSRARQVTKKDYEETHLRTKLRDGDVVVVNTGASIGKTALVSDLEVNKNTTFQKSVAVISVNKNLLSNSYLNQYIILNKEDIYLKASGSAQKNWLLSQMRSYDIMNPPISLQNQFAEQIQNIEQQKEKLKAQIKESVNLFQALLQKAFNGGLN